MGDLIWVRFFSKPLVIEFFFPDIQRCKIFFPAFYFMKDIVFSVGISFGQVLPCKNFFPSKSVCRIFFLKSLIPPSKVECSAPLLVYVLFFQCTQGHVIIALENCLIQISRFPVHILRIIYEKTKRPIFPETFIGKTKHQGPKLTYFEDEAIHIDSNINL